MISRKRVMTVAVGISMLLASAAWAGSTIVSTQGKLVTFTSRTVISLNNGVRSGTFKIICAPISKATLRHEAWMAECNKLGSAAIKKEVASGLIHPVSGPAFVQPSSVKGALQKVDSLTFTRSFALVEDKI